MQAVAVSSFTVSLPLKGTKNLVPRRSPTLQRTLISPRAIAISASESSTIDYSSSISVFPMEACELIGGHACAAQMFPEIKLAAAEANGSNSSAALQEIDRQYLDYDERRTVFPDEACDNLGGEFCEADYQLGVLA
ncbi:light-regulated protein, chloroplastic-like [Typha latifolia]|uniref:light-regulated protein, chloroplastic-like n=1 Tax=Typha latifolia TaxID=4733 RepID=UPI003C2C9C76